MVVARNTLKYAVAWLVLVALFTALAGRLNLLAYWKLAHHGVSAAGRVVKVPDMNATVRYRYDVDGHQYFGRMSPWPPNPGITLLAEGATVTVWYDPDEPALSVLGSPDALLQNEIISVALAGFLAPTFIVFAWRYHILPRWQRHWPYVRDHYQ